MVLDWKRIVYDHSSPNITGVDKWLAASVMPNEPDGMAVPLLELAAHGFLALGISIVVGLIASKRRFGKPVTHTDSWESFEGVDWTVRLFTAVGSVNLVLVVCAVVLMLVRIRHDGAYAVGTFTGPPQLPLPLSPPPSPQDARANGASILCGGFRVPGTPPNANFYAVSGMDEW